MTPQELDAIRARANAASPGPWQLDSLGWSQADTVCRSGGRQYWVAPVGYGDGDAIAGLSFSTCQCGDGECPEWGDIPEAQYCVDAEFIAHSREDVPALLGEIDMLDRLVYALFEELADCDKLRDYVSRASEIMEVVKAGDSVAPLWDLISDLAQHPLPSADGGTS